MNKGTVYVYGAGRRALKYEALLKNRGIEIAAFLDSNKSENDKINMNGRVYSIVSLATVEKNGIPVVIAIADNSEYQKVHEAICAHEIEIVTIEDVLYDAGFSVEAKRNYVSQYHDNCMQDYFESAEKNLGPFWDIDTPFRKMFDRLNLMITVELACGHGRHVNQYADKVEKLLLVDISQDNIDFCKNRFSGDSRIECFKNEGYDLGMIENESCTALFTYDAMVHFEFLDIFQYLVETRRILKYGGMALFHHSNNTKDYKVSFSSGACGRNYMSKDLFAFLANRAGLKVVEQVVIDWGESRIWIV